MLVCIRIDCLGIFFHDSNARSIIGLFLFIAPRLGFSLSVYLAPFSSIFRGDGRPLRQNGFREKNLFPTSLYWHYCHTLRVRGQKIWVIFVLSNLSVGMRCGCSDSYLLEQKKNCRFVKIMWPLTMLSVPIIWVFPWELITGGFKSRCLFTIFSIFFSSGSSRRSSSPAASRAGVYLSLFFYFLSFFHHLRLPVGAHFGGSCKSSFFFSQRHIQAMRY